MSAVIIEGGLVHYEALGRGRPVLFIHGWLGSWRYWMPTMEAMSDRYRTYALDLWGFGDSEKSVKSPQRYEIESYVSLIGAFMEDLGLSQHSPSVIVGHALGAVAAILFAARMPDRIDKIMAVSPPFYGSALSRKLLGGGDSVLDRTIGRRQAQQAYPEVALEADKADGNAIAFSTRSVINLDLRREMEKVTLPLLIVHGEKDSVVASPTTDDVNGLGPNVRSIPLKDSTHFPMLDEAAKFQRLLRDFLEGGLTSLELKDEWKRRTR